MIWFRTLGRIDLEGVEEEASRSVLRGSKRLGLLAHLVLARPGGYLRRDTLLALFWPDRDARRARHALRNTLYELRQALGAPTLPGRGQDEVGVDLGELSCDALDVRRALEAGDDAEAVELYAGELLPGLHVDGASRAFEEWLDEERTALRRDVAGAARRLSDEAEAAGRLEEAARRARRAVELAPYDEPSLRRLMELLARGGNRAAAVRAYRAFEERISSELGLRPGDETRALAATIRSADTAADTVDAGPEGAADPSPPAEAEAGGGEDRGAGTEPGRIPDARESAGGGRPGSRGWRTPAAVAGALVVAVGGLAALLGDGSGGASREGTLAADGVRRVAVFPFAVRGAGDSVSAFLGGGLSTLLAADLDGTGGFQAVDPRVLGGRSTGGEGGVGPGRAAEVSEGLDADAWVLGDVVSSAGRVHLSAALYGRPAGAALARASVEGDRGEVFRLVDRLAAELLAARYPDRELPLVRTAARTTGSLEALKAYLAGEEHFRAGRFASAVSEYQRAVEADSTFSLAHHRLSVTAEWVGNSGLAADAAERALRRADRLPGRERRLLSAHLISLEGDAGEAERRYREILATYPADLEAWYQLGEILFHYGPAVGRSLGEARAAFERVRELSPDHVPSLVHLARIAASEGCAAEVSRLAGLVLALVPGSTHAWEMRALEAHAGQADDAERAELMEGLRQASERSVRLATWNVAVFAEEPAAAARLAGLLTAPWRSPGARRLGREWRAELALARGRWREARRILSAGPEGREAFHAHRGAVLATLPFVGVRDSTLRALRTSLASGGDGGGTAEGAAGSSETPDADTGAVGAELRALRPRLRLFAEGLLRSRAGDVDEALARAERLEAPPEAGGALPLVERLGRIVRGHVAWGRDEPGRALEILGEESVETRSSLMFGVDYVQPYERYLRARALQAAGRGEEALRWLASFRHQHVHHLVYLGPALFRRGQILEDRGDAAGARQAYRGFLELWREPDPGMRGMRREALRSLERLGRGGGGADGRDTTWDRGVRGASDTVTARLEAEDGAFTLVYRRDGRRISVDVPRPWLIPPDAAEAAEGGLVDPFRYDSAVTAFRIDGSRVGLHLSSYDVQDRGSAAAAAGRDVFLVLVPSEGTLLRGGLGLGITKSRGRRMGCFEALAHRFLVADVDGDGHADLGVEREEIRCRPDESRAEPELEAPLVPEHRVDPVRWHLFEPGVGWSHDARHDGRRPAGVRELPLVGLTKTPVQFVREVTGGSGS